MAENITRCPKCYTSFRISDSHLNTEKGAVRCGSCLNIFNAKQNLIRAVEEPTTAKKAAPRVVEPKPATPPASAPQASKTAPQTDAARAQKEKAALEQEKARAREKQKAEESAREKQLEEQRKEEQKKKERLQAIEKEKQAAKEKERLALKAKQRDSALSPTVSHKPVESLRKDDKDSDLETDDDILISDDMEYEDDIDPTTRSGSDSHIDAGFDESIFSNTDTGEYEFNLFEREAASDNEDSESKADESWALDLLQNDDTQNTRSADKKPNPRDELDEDERQTVEEFDESYYKNSPEAAKPAPAPTRAADKKSHTKPSASVDITDNELDDYDNIEIDEYDYSDDTFSEPQSSGSSRYLNAIEPEPVEFNWQRHSTAWDSKLVWGAGSLLVGVLLFAQIAWIKFDSLSVVEPYRAYYAKACKIVSCTLPALSDLSKIRATNLVVRSHPTERNALIVDAVLQNTAKFEQNFPALDLVFTNNQDKIVAARRLKPSNYLTGELAGKTKMPVKQPIHIAIEIVDPGSDAIGYKISIGE